MRTAHVRSISDLTTPAAGRDQWLRRAAACLYPGCSVVCCTQRARVRSRVQEERERVASAQGVACLLDPGSNAHLTNVRGVLVPGSVVPCYVEVQGLNGDGLGLLAKEKGKYKYKLNESEKVVLNDMLYVPDSVIGNTVNEPMVLVSSGRMAKECGVGTHFVAGGDGVEFIRDGHVVGGFDTSTDCGLYVDKREQTDKAKEREKMIALCASILYDSSASVKHEHENKHESEQTDKANEREKLIALCASVLNDSSVSVKHVHENENENESESEKERERETE